MPGKGEVLIKIVGDSTDFDKTLLGMQGKMSKFASGNVAKFGAAFVGAGVIAGVALYKIGESFDAAYDKIRVKTGATGQVLGGLKEDFRKVVVDVPTTFDKASEAIGGVYQRLHITGKPLREVSEGILELTRLTGGDLTSNIASLTRVFGDWSIPVDQQSKALDKMYRTTQITGIGLDDLATQVVNFGSPLRQLGFTFEESLALFGRFEKEGVNTGTVMSGLRFGLKTFAKAGKEPSEALEEVIQKIKGAATAADANKIAFDTFGVRAGPDMAAAIREGRFELDAYTNSITNGSDTIKKGAKDTEDFSEKWQKFKNKVLIAIEPIATKFFTGLGKLMDKVGPGIEEFGNRWTRALPKFQRFADRMDRGKDKILDVFRRMHDGGQKIANLYNNIDDAVKRFFDRMYNGGQKVVNLYNNIDDAVKRFVDRMLLGYQRIIDAIQRFRDRMQAGIDAIVGFFASLPGRVVAVVGDFLGFLRDQGTRAWQWISDKVNGIVGFFTSLPGRVAGAAGDAFAAVKNAMSSARDWVSGKVNELVGFISGLPGRISGLAGSVFGAAASIGRAIINGIGGGLSAVGGFIGDLASAVTDAFKRAGRAVIQIMNDAIPDSLNFGPIHIGLPHNPIPSFHTGGVFNSGRGEGPALLQDGEGIFTRSQMRALGTVGGSGTVNIYLPAGSNGKDVVQAQRRYNRRNGVLS